MISAKDFVNAVETGNKTEAQIRLISLQLDEALIKSIASGNLGKVIPIEGIKKSDLTEDTIRSVETAGYRIACNYIGCNPEAVRLIL